MHPQQNILQHKMTPKNKSHVLSPPMISKPGNRTGLFWKK